MADLKQCDRCQKTSSIDETQSYTRPWAKVVVTYFHERNHNYESRQLEVCNDCAARVEHALEYFNPAIAAVQPPERVITTVDPNAPKFPPTDDENIPF